jgi:hypothetical protein
MCAVPFWHQPSLCSLNATVQSLGARSVDRRQLGAHWAATWAKALARALRTREAFPEAFHDVLYVDLIADPLRVVRALYDRFGYQLSREVQDTMAEELARNRQHKRGIHRYSLASFGLEAEVERERFQGYVERFRIPSEDQQA